MCVSDGFSKVPNFFFSVFRRSGNGQKCRAHVQCDGAARRKGNGNIHGAKIHMISPKFELVWQMRRQDALVALSTITKKDCSIRWFRKMFPCMHAKSDSALLPFLLFFRIQKASPGDVVVNQGDKLNTILFLYKGSCGSYLDITLT